MICMRWSSGRIPWSRRRSSRIVIAQYASIVKFHARRMSGFGSLLRNPSASAVVISQHRLMARPAFRWLLAVQMVCVRAFAPSQHVRATPPFARRQPLPRLCMWPEGGDEEETEREVDADMAWRQFRYEQTIAGEGWWQDLRREVRLQSVSTRERLEEVSALIVAAVVFLILLKTYLVAAGGGIVIVPDDRGCMHLYNFKELQGLEPSELLKLHLPAAPLPSPISKGSPMLMIEQELSLTLRGLLLGFAGDVQPPA